MSLMANSPELKTMALGPVAIGSINAQEAAMVAGIIKRKGCTLIASAKEASTGSIMDAVATFEVTSVRKLTKRATIKMIKNSGSSDRPVS